jgi:hypothetical protein
VADTFKTTILSKRSFKFRNKDHRRLLYASERLKKVFKVVGGEITQEEGEKNSHSSSRTVSSKQANKSKVYSCGFEGFKNLKSQFGTFKQLTGIEDK